MFLSVTTSPKKENPLWFVSYLDFDTIYAEKAIVITLWGGGG
jgi:hypothetical protein